MIMFKETTIEEIDDIMRAAWEAFHSSRKLSLRQRADFMRNIGEEIENLGDELLQIAHIETHLPEARLRK